MTLHLTQIKLGELEAELIEMNANSEKLQRAYNELLEYKLVLQKVCIFLTTFENRWFKPVFFFMVFKVVFQNCLLFIIQLHIKCLCFSTISNVWGSKRFFSFYSLVSLAIMVSGCVFGLAIGTIIFQNDSIIAVTITLVKLVSSLPLYCHCSTVQYVIRKLKKTQCDILLRGMEQGKKEASLFLLRC